ncbi:TPA: PA3371 family protein [Pseudomonas aeruginosa]
MSRSAVILLFVVIASAILALSLPPDATLLAWCAWGLLGISGAWLLFALVVGRRIRCDPSLD